MRIFASLALEPAMTVPTSRLRFPRRLLGLLPAALFVPIAACSGGGSASLPDSGESGFRMADDAFPFENFADTYSAATLNTAQAVRMFGEAAVCQPNVTPCVPTLAAAAWIDTANHAMEAGHCEGFAVLSQMFHLGALKPETFGASTTRGLFLDENYPLQHELAYWFATQLVPGAVTNKALMPRDVIPFLAEAFKPEATDYYRIGFAQRTPTGFGAAHSLTPIGFYREAGDVFVIRVYDNNFPAQERRIRLDVAANTWSYEGVSSTGPVRFEGGASLKNPLYFAPTKARTGQLACPFCTGSERQIVVEGADPLVKDSTGESGFKNGELVVAPGGTVTPGYASCVNVGASVQITSKATASDPAVVTLNPNGAKSQSVTVTGGAIGPVKVSGDIASGSPAQIQASGNSVSVQSDAKTTTLSFPGEGGTTITVNVSGASGGVTVTRDPATGKISVDTKDGKDAVIRVTLEAPGGAKTNLEVVGKDGTTNLTVTPPPGGWQGGAAPPATSDATGTVETVPGGSCYNRVKDGAESDVDCGGGRCAKCPTNKDCAVPSDCSTGFCHSKYRVCVPSFHNEVKDGTEVDIDCGGSDPAVPRCIINKVCVADGDCDVGLWCQASSHTCKASTRIGGTVTPPLPLVEVSVSPAGLSRDPLATPVAVSSALGSFVIADTRVLDTWNVQVTRPPAGYLCSVASQGTRTNVGLISDVRVNCVTNVDACTDGQKNVQETDVDCGGADCAPAGKFCAVGKACLVDRDCGAPSEHAICLSNVCKRTYDLLGTASVTVPVTLELTPGGTLGGASATPLQTTVLPGAKTFQISNTRVTGNYSVSVVPSNGVNCSLSGGTGVAAANVTTLGLVCSSCGNGTLEGAETDIDCGGAACIARGKTCATAKKCVVNADCTSGACDPGTHLCAGAATCADGFKNGAETDVDCGGATCNAQNKKCALNKACGAGADCQSGVCTGNLCSNPAGAWSAVAATFGAAGTTYARASAISDTDVWAIGGSDVGHYNGVTWTTVQPAPGAVLTGLFARGGAQTDVWITAADNVVQHWNGVQWTVEQATFNGGSSLEAIHGSVNAVVLVGSAGQVARYDIGTGSFLNEFGPPLGGPPPTAEDLHAVFVPDDNSGWAVGNNGVAISYNGGQWSLVPTGTNANLRTIWGTSNTDLWAAGDGGVVIHWDGGAWSTVASGTAQSIRSLWGTASNSVWAAGDAGTLQFWNGGVWAAENSGTAQNLYAVTGGAASRWAFGANKTFMKRN